MKNMRSMVPLTNTSMQTEWPLASMVIVGIRCGVQRIKMRGYGRATALTCLRLHPL